MNINFTDEIERYIQCKLQSGMYGSVAELVREAMREKIQREVREGIEGARVRPDRSTPGLARERDAVRLVGRAPGLEARRLRVEDQPVEVEDEGSDLVLGRHRAGSIRNRRRLFKCERPVRRSPPPSSSLRSRRQRARAAAAPSGTLHAAGAAPRDGSTAP